MWDSLDLVGFLGFLGLMWVDVVQLWIGFGDWSSLLPWLQTCCCHQMLLELVAMVRKAGDEVFHARY